MIEIKKNKEPEQLTTYRLSKKLEPSYSKMHGLKVSQFIEGGSDEDLYKIVLDSLAKEQGYLCAYCMRRIPQKSVYPQMTIEHVIPQNSAKKNNPILSITYSNMVAVCNGNRNSLNNKDKTCDAKRGTLPDKEQVLFVNPLESSTLRNIYYYGNGEIHSSDDDQEKCINDVLNLNCSAVQLPDARKSALNALQGIIHNKYHNRTAPPSYFQDLLNHYQNQEKKTPYVGILIWWLILF